MKDQERDCQHCSHYVWNEAGFYSCEKWNCEFTPDKVARAIIDEAKERKC